MDILSDIESFGRLFLELLNKQKANREAAILHSHISKAKSYNHWFTEDFVNLRLTQICNFLYSEKFISSYSELLKKNIQKGKYFGISSEEKIPLEEFPILLFLLLSGNSFSYKIFEKSDKLLQFFFELLGKNIQGFKERIDFTVSTIKNAEKFIVTRQKEERAEIKKYYEKKELFYEIRYPSVAVLDGNEQPEDLNLLGKDIFTFFGMGPGNIKKLYLPRGYDLQVLFRALEKWNFLNDHNAYANNCQYYRSVYLLNKISFFDTGFMLFKEDSGMRSPTSVLYYEFFEDKKAILGKLNNSLNVSHIFTLNPVSPKELGFGESLTQLLIPSENFINFLQ